jgi:hypothetical protein
MRWNFRANIVSGLIWNEHTTHMLPHMASVILTLDHVVIKQCATAKAADLSLWERVIGFLFGPEIIEI